MYYYPRVDHGDRLGNSLDCRGVSLCVYLHSSRPKTQGGDARTTKETGGKEKATFLFAVCCETEAKVDKAENSKVRCCIHASNTAGGMSTALLDSFM